jgi:hydrogenase maturation protein HypF
VSAPSVTIRRTRAQVHGTVQGVGFRPYVYRLAGELGLTGFVLNDSRGVLLEIEGPAAAIEEFLQRLAPDAPPLAVIEGVSTQERDPTGAASFAILASPRDGVANAPVTPDSATCTDCLAELFDPRDRRYRYPFINCTNCGPRFTIVRGVPYDRPLTTMAGFAMCPDCRSEYENPTDRRFHAQPNACPQCGPSVALARSDGGSVSGSSPADPVSAAAAALRDGAIVAIKGIGGYHLAARADDERAVARLRARKHREDKPFALMVASIAAAQRLVWLGAAERALLSGPERPIVLAPRRPGAPVADAVAPGAPELGVMLPYSPLHHLVLADLDTTLVLTSGNVSDEPIAYRAEDALERLGAIADLFLVHDRPIQTRTDDSVVRVLHSPEGPRTAFLRRSRGYVPAGLPIPEGGCDRPLLACGAELKSTFCVAKGSRAWVSHHIGDLENYETLSSFTEGIEHFERLFAVTPEVVAHDLHPAYLSTRYALERDGVRLVGVQHHHAHLAACLGEHGVTGAAVGAIFDGTGYGSDGTVWGGEILVGDLAEFRRAGTLRPVRLPGGAQAIRQPWRMACAWLAAAGEGQADPPKQFARRVDAASWRQVGQLLRTGLRSPPTSSMGRLFDAAAALCGLRCEVNYEGQAAIELEAACDPGERGAYPIELSGETTSAGPETSRGAGPETPHGEECLLEIDPRETIRALAADIERGTPVGVVAARFHGSVAQVTVEACARAAAAHGTEVVVLSGGVFQNRRLLATVHADLDAAGLRVLVPSRLPANDGGISYGQAAVASARMAAG